LTGSSKHFHFNACVADNSFCYFRDFTNQSIYIYLNHICFKRFPLCLQQAHCI